MRYIGGSQLEAALVWPELIGAIEGAYRMYGAGEYTMPLRTHVEGAGGTLLYMPCFTGEGFGTKVLSLFPENRKRGKPAITGVMLLNDGQTGEVAAILDAAALTALRTGAVGGCAARHLAPPDASNLGVVGAGVQGFYQALAVCSVREINCVRVYDPVGCEDFVRRLAARLPGRRVLACAGPEELLRESEIVVTATTARSPVLPGAPALLEGKCLIAIGSYKPEMRELPDGAFSLADRVYVDTLHALEESGDLIGPLEQGLLRRENVIEFSAVLSGEEKPPEKGVRLFKSVGMALFDLVAARTLQKACEEQGIGTELVP